MGTDLSIQRVTAPVTTVGRFRAVLLTGTRGAAVAWADFRAADGPGVAPDVVTGAAADVATGAAPGTVRNFAPHVAQVEVTVWRPDRPGPFRDRHLCARPTATDRWQELADVLVGPYAPGPGRRPAGATDALAHGHPGALVLASPQGPGRCRVRIGAGTRLVLSRIPGTAACSTLPTWAVWASLLHGWLAAGVSAETLAPACALLIRRGAAAAEATAPEPAVGAAEVAAAGAAATSAAAQAGSEVCDRISLRVGWR
jgi:hypothetical protein